MMPLRSRQKLDSRREPWEHLLCHHWCSCRRLKQKDKVAGVVSTWIGSSWSTSPRAAQSLVPALFTAHLPRLGAPIIFLGPQQQETKDILLLILKVLFLHNCCWSTLSALAVINSSAQLPRKNGLTLARGKASSQRDFSSLFPRDRSPYWRPRHCL